MNETTLCLQVSLVLADVNPRLSELFLRVSSDAYMGRAVLRAQLAAVRPGAPNGITQLDCPRCPVVAPVKNYRIYGGTEISCPGCREIFRGATS